MASKKIGHLGSEIALIQQGFANESVAGLYDVCQSRPLRSDVSAGSPALAATLLSKSFSDERPGDGWRDRFLGDLFTNRSGPEKRRSVSRMPFCPVIYLRSFPDERFVTSGRPQLSQDGPGVDQSALFFSQVFAVTSPLPLDQ